ncbi:MAG: AbrB/MazE/SpoVT family DNA-binding domain-containing protein [Defluviitaleaceae bacterium]|nr:AbrB/MazE/SpoVT family DNA-binding domain-containing protein [Defluviitaleaceae bacterium]MCL2621290.1 AbrB/MazE/SpoVT family DNA-binding domain-containing protein [Defluviitaleaceae bacterium]
MENKKKFLKERVIDELNRIVIPAEARDLLCLEKGTKVNVYVEADKIIIERIGEPCPSCGR